MKPIISNKRSIEICKRLDRIAAELRNISFELGRPINVMTHINKDGQSATTVYAAGYRKDHYYDGYERMSYGQHTVSAEQVVFGRAPIGLETDIMQRDLKRNMQKMKKK